MCVRGRGRLPPTDVHTIIDARAHPKLHHIIALPHALYHVAHHAERTMEVVIESEVPRVLPRGVGEVQLELCARLDAEPDGRDAPAPRALDVCHNAPKTKDGGAPRAPRVPTVHPSGAVGHRAPRLQPCTHESRVQLTRIKGAELRAVFEGARHRVEMHHHVSPVLKDLTAHGRTAPEHTEELGLVDAVATTSGARGL